VSGSSGVSYLLLLGLVTLGGILLMLAIAAGFFLVAVRRDR